MSCLNFVDLVIFDVKFLKLFLKVLKLRIFLTEFLEVILGLFGPQPSVRSESFQELRYAILGALD